ncbi:MAG: alpha/beta hydrolase [Pseudomonadota bacterium]
MRFAMIIVFLLLAGCTQNAQPFISAEDAQIKETVYLAAMRKIVREDTDPPYQATIKNVASQPQKDLYLLNRAGEPRADEMVFLVDDLSLPKAAAIGASKVPLSGLKPNPDQHIAYISRRQVLKIGSFARQAWKTYGGGADKLVLFVHGNNVNMLEATKRYAKVQQDYQLKEKNIPAVTFIGQSSGIALGYAYDRESLRHDRTNLEQLVTALTQHGEIIIVAHSLGSDFVMETLARISLRGSKKVKEKVKGVILIAPDLSIEVFKSQIKDVKPLPSNFVVLSHTGDLPLRVSAAIRANKRRLGLIGTQNKDDLTAASELCSKGVRFVDLKLLKDNNFLNHTNPFTSERTISVLKAYINKPDFIDSWIVRKARQDIADLYQKRESKEVQELGIDFDRVERMASKPSENLDSNEAVLEPKNIPRDIVEEYLNNSKSLETSGVCQGSPFRDVRSES